MATQYKVVRYLPKRGWISGSAQEPLEVGFERVCNELAAGGWSICQVFSNGTYGKSEDYGVFLFFEQRL